jgi:hypothetical protein
MKRILTAAVALAGLVAAASAIAADDNSNVPVTLAVFGDWPYSNFLLDNADLLINSVNSDRKVDAVIHVGDIHAGSLKGANDAYLCTSAGILPPISTSNPGWNQGVFAQFQKFNAPVIYTPGDNEWTDCHKSGQGKSGAPLNELASVRSLFFSRPGHTLGLTDKKVWSQKKYYDPNHMDDAQFVENVMWMDRRVLFATFNMPGGSNNDSVLTARWGSPFTDDTAQLNEETQRTAADIRWLEAAFATAEQAPRAKAVVLVLQADMWDPEALPSHVPPGTGLDHYTSFVQRFADLAVDYGGPVLLLNGDTHLSFSDKPLANPLSTTGQIHHTQAVPNLTRIVVQGSTNDPGEWLRLTIDTRRNQPFSATNVVYCNSPSTKTC